MFQIHRHTEQGTDYYIFTTGMYWFLIITAESKHWDIQSSLLVIFITLSLRNNILQNSAHFYCR